MLEFVEPTQIMLRWSRSRRRNGIVHSFRTYTSGIVEYGDFEAFEDGTSTMDMTGKAMIDTIDLYSEMA